MELDDLLQDLAEVSLGAAILGVRRLNIARRALVEQVPAAAPTVDALLDQVDELAEPVSEALGAIVAAFGQGIAGERGQQVRDVGATIAEGGPELLRLSGLTKRP